MTFQASPAFEWTKQFMAYLNYTTEIPSEKSVQQIQAMLIRKKAHAILTEYDGEGVLTAISFRIKNTYGILSFRLPANVPKVFAILVRDPKIRPGLKTRDQAARVAWRVVKDWLEAQMAILELEMVDLEQIFLPFAQNVDGATVYETMKLHRFESLNFSNTKTLCE